MKIVIFSGGGSHTANAPDGTLRWHMSNPDGSESVSEVKMYEYRQHPIHKLVYVALFREVYKGEIAEAAVRHGFDA